LSQVKTTEPKKKAKRTLRRAVKSEPGAGWQWITHRPSKSTLYISLISILLGVAMAVAWQQNRVSDELANARPGDLVQILDRLSVERNRLQAELNDVLRREETLVEGATAEAIAETQARADQFAILAGVVPVTGPGIEVTVRDPDLSLSSVALLDLIQELRDAGAEAISINDERVVASTWFADAPEGTSVSGVTVNPPYRVKAIGDPRTMEVALAIPGGFSEGVRAAGGTVSVIRIDALDILAVVPPVDPAAPRP
jgi:uncharacterized protein YlxW (UPF0749 family)